MYLQDRPSQPMSNRIAQQTPDSPQKEHMRSHVGPGWVAVSRQVLTSSWSLISSPALTQARHSFPPWMPRSTVWGSMGTTSIFSGERQRARSACREEEVPMKKSLDASWGSSVLLTKPKVLRTVGPHLSGLHLSRRSNQEQPPSCSSGPSCLVSAPPDVYLPWIPRDLHTRSTVCCSWATSSKSQAFLLQHVY